MTQLSTEDKKFKNHEKNTIHYLFSRRFNTSIKLYSNYNQYYFKKRTSLKKTKEKDEDKKEQKQD